MILKKIKQKINKFVKDRDWEQFHSPKNLAMALSVEVSELVEIFQWLKDSDIKKVDKKKSISRNSRYLFLFTKNCRKNEH